jgi:hypothetical protein
MAREGPRQRLPLATSDRGQRLYLSGRDPAEETRMPNEPKKPDVVPQADVAAEREIAERAGNQQQPVAPQEEKDQQQNKQ